ncbi:uncharacterized protein N7511_001849 [Penicillium nucicola]|uniref:uncharacterized protein n=1 Tax=Penicillium nucicola TaxID=1850975 RepID=UPI0025450B39|nr:uncharacterized protein N7511_001849 [Penicillium nucicola]KAJ5769798.1 hypothetical protein N7511_001849 [Penicillium nucicola]
MKDSLYDRLWRRECGERSAYSGLRGIYGSKEWVSDLDIVNELGGHTGCVNALSWSRSGQLLASGSDDQHLNIYSYQPESSNAPFALNTTVFTGHKANIFSVKFMPQSNDGTVITCAGDSQVRVFDIEYSSGSRNTAATSAFEASARSRRFNEFFSGARYLSDGNTNARIYRSHADRVKRIVTESSPYLFLTCSEDGEVRQWDLRLPSSAYPPPRGGQGFMAYRPGLNHDDSNVPPPLISYKPYSLDLNTISCSPSQPHYIALGGAHLHCFLHDRRMLGRDKSAEKGAIGGDDEEMGKATRCVRRFAPGGKRRMRHLDDGHITACKISDANPDEMIVSWSGDHIYSFDLIRSPDAGETKDKKSGIGKGGRSRRSSQVRKRKRQKPATPDSQGSGGRHESRRRSAEPDTFRIQYENGEAEDVSFPSLADSATETPEDILERARYTVLSDAQRLSMEIAKGLVKLRKTLFSLEATAREALASDGDESDLYQEAFSSASNIATTCLSQMNNVMSEWRYPLNPTAETVAFQQSLRRNRESSWRFTLAAGNLAQELGNFDPSHGLDIGMIRPAPGEETHIDRQAQFGYDFLRAIVLWMRGGRSSVLEGFRRRSGPRRGRAHDRYPIPDEYEGDAIDEVLIPYLLELASDTPIVNVDASRFEHDSTRFLFQSQRAAVIAFGNAVKLPLEDLEGSAAQFDRRRVSNPSSHVRSLDRASARRFWLLRVGRGILMEAGSGVNYTFVNNAFGGLHTITDSDSDSDSERNQEDIDPLEEEQVIRQIELVSAGPSRQANPDVDTNSEASQSDSAEDSTDDDEGERAIDSSDEEDENEEGSDDDDDDDESTTRRYAIRRSRQEKVEMNTPCSSHMRSYRGHCNIKTVKDVNFFGLDDEYVVSGSDSGHIFIWDRKTSHLVNILEGDSEVVNVVQGHPYEPLIAASGIDNTIKIFSADRTAQANASQGINILDPDFRGNRPGITHIGGLESRKRIHDSYRIMNENDVERRGGMSEAYITRSMLARLAATLRGRQGGVGGMEGLGAHDGDTPVVLDDNCSVM